MPRSYQRNGRWHIDLGLFTLTARGVTSSSSSAVSSSPGSPTLDDDSVPMLPLSFDVRPSSPTASESSTGESMGLRRPGIRNAIYRAGNRVVTSITGRSHDRARGRSPLRRGWQNRGVLFFLPAIFTPTGVPAFEQTSRLPSQGRPISRTPSRARTPHEKSLYTEDLEAAGVYGASSSSHTAVDGSPEHVSSSRPPTPGGSVRSPVPSHAPPPYPSSGNASAAARSATWNTEGSWEEWESR